MTTSEEVRATAGDFVRRRVVEGTRGSSVRMSEAGCARPQNSTPIQQSVGVVVPKQPVTEASRGSLQSWGGLQCHQFAESFSAFWHL